MSEPFIQNDHRIKRIENYISRMPSLSTTVTKVLEVCNSPNTSPNDLNRVISLDPVLTGKVLRLINSAYYSLPSRITSLTRAIIMLGLNTVKNLALSTAILESVGGKDSFRALQMDRFWTHSICVGVTAKSLSRVIGVPMAQREEYFVTGLLHDLGKIPLNNRFPEDYMKALELTSLKNPPLFESEGIVFGIDHMEVGLMIGEKWRLNDAMIESLRFHHNPETAKEDNRNIVAIVALANACTNIFEIGAAGDVPPGDPILMDLLDLVGIKWNTITNLQKTVMDEIDKAKIFLQVSKA